MSYAGKATLKEVFSNLMPYLDVPVFALETGVTYLWDEQYRPFVSTPNIVEHLVKPSIGYMVSIDISDERINIAKDMIDYEPYDGYIGDSLEVIPKLFKYKNFFNFFWLDSCEDAEHGAEEYLLAVECSKRPYIICVDDYGCENSVKWRISSQFIKENADEYKIYNTPTGLIAGIYK